jgi:thiol-disulfide isomerase/thioredoxin
MFIAKKTIRILATITFGWLLLSDPGLAAGSTTAEKLKLPKAPLPGLTGSDAFAGDTGKKSLTVIQFWASWCTGCGTVMGQMTDLVGKNSKLGYVTVSLDETKVVAMKFFANKEEKAKSALPVSYLDASGAGFAEPNGVESLPYMIVVDKAGAVVKRIKGHPTKSDIEFLSKK